MEPFVSIVIPAFNCEAWIAKSIESALAQTWNKKEIIVVDDGSTDQTLEIARRYSSKTVSVLTQENQGAAAARNKGFASAQGNYVQWLDGDDLLAPDKIATQMAVAAEVGSKRTIFSSEWGSFFYRFEKARFSPSSLWCDLSPAEWLVRNLGNNHWMQPAAWLVSRELTELAGPWDIRLSLDDDGEYFSRVVAASDRVRFVPGARAFYRRSPNSLSTMSLSHKKWESQFLSIRLQCERLRSMEDSGRTKDAVVHCLQRYVTYFYPERLDLVEEARKIAGKFGRELSSPTLPLKYALVRALFGWAAAKGTRAYYNRSKASLMRSWDKALFRLGNHCKKTRLYGI